MTALRAIILAGGKGTRLKPYTLTVPKPLMPVGGEMPILEVLVRQLARCGFERLTLAVSQEVPLISAYFGNGSKWGIQIDYSVESEPLSTIGPLTLIRDLPENFLVMNGDLLCDLDYGAFLRGHVESRGEISVATFRRSVHSDFGVVTISPENRIVGFREKPVFNLDVSMGVYALSRSIVTRLPPGKAYGFDDLMLEAIREGWAARAVPYSGYWLDIGRPEDYDVANQEFPKLRPRLGL